MVCLLLGAHSLAPVSKYISEDETLNIEPSLFYIMFQGILLGFVSHIGAKYHVHMHHSLPRNLDVIVVCLGMIYFFIQY